MPQPPVSLRVLVTGHVTQDRYGNEFLPGGGAFYGASTFRVLGASTRLVTAFGEDFTGADARPVTHASALEGIEVAARRGRQTTVFENTYLPDGTRRQRLLSRADDLPPPSPGAVEPPDVLFLAPVIGELDPAAWARAVPARVIGLSAQGLVRQADARPGSRGVRVKMCRYQPAPDTLRHIGAVFLSEQDIAGQEDLVERLCCLVPIVALTRGERGATVFANGGVLHIGVFRTREVDPTGAGDVFAAAFLFALARGEDIASCGRLAAAAASIVIEGKGGTTLERIGEASNRMEYLPVAHE